MGASSQSTYTWTSPHRALGSEAPDPRSDCWSADLWVSLQMRCRSPKSTQTKRQRSMAASQSRFQTKFKDRFGIKSNNLTLMGRAAWMWLRETRKDMKTQGSHCMQEFWINQQLPVWYNSYKTQLFLLTASVSPHVQGLMLTLIIKEWTNCRRMED